MWRMATLLGGRVQRGQRARAPLAKVAMLVRLALMAMMIPRTALGERALTSRS